MQHYTAEVIIIKGDPLTEISQFNSNYYTYALCNETSAIYVGASCSIYKRLRFHARKWNFNKVILRQCSTYREALKIEGEWIAKLKPTENKIKGGSIKWLLNTLGK